MTTLEKAEAVISKAWAELRASQAKRPAGTRFWQGFSTHDEVPEADSHVRERSGPDRPRWKDMMPSLPDRLACQMEVHEYEGPKGRGFRLIVLARQDGKLWRYTLQDGPESRDDEGRWVEAVTPP